jgi:hypothetical protein
MHCFLRKIYFLAQGYEIIRLSLKFYGVSISLMVLVRELGLLRIRNRVGSDYAGTSVPKRNSAYKDKNKQSSVYVRVEASSLTTTVCLN